MAGVTGLEPAASCVTGKRSNQLSYTPKDGKKRYELVKGKISLVKIMAYKLHYYKLFCVIPTYVKLV